MAGGRPTDYNEDLLLRAKGYLSCYKELDQVLPSVEGLSRYLNIARSTIYDWASQPEKQEFSDILNQILSEQGLKLINNGLSGDFNAVIAKMLLSSKHGYVEETKVDQRNINVNFTKDGKDMTDEELLQIAKS